MARTDMQSMYFQQQHPVAVSIRPRAATCMKKPYYAASKLTKTTTTRTAQGPRCNHMLLNLCSPAMQRRNASSNCQSTHMSCDAFEHVVTM